MICAYCDLDCNLDEIERTPSGLFRCIDIGLCNTRVRNQVEKQRLLNNLKRAESEPLELPGIIEDLLDPCSICGKKADHRYHDAARCQWCKRSLGLVPGNEALRKIVPGWCDECRASWKLEIEKEMGK